MKREKYGNVIRLDVYSTKLKQCFEKRNRAWLLKKKLSSTDFLGTFFE